MIWKWKQTSPGEHCELLPSPDERPVYSSKSSLTPLQSMRSSWLGDTSRFKQSGIKQLEVNIPTTPISWDTKEKKAFDLVFPFRAYCFEFLLMCWYICTLNPTDLSTKRHKIIFFFVCFLHCATSVLCVFSSTCVRADELESLCWEDLIALL